MDISTNFSIEWNDNRTVKQLIPTIVLFGLCNDEEERKGSTIGKVRIYCGLGKALPCSVHDEKNDEVWFWAAMFERYL